MVFRGTIPGLYIYIYIYPFVPQYQRAKKYTKNEVKMKHEEAKLQAEIVKALQGVGLWAFSIPNEGAGGNVVKMGQLISMGLKAGVSDLEVWKGGQTVYMEIKAPGGAQSKAQKSFQTRCQETGRAYVVVWSVQEALDYMATV